MQEVSRKKLLEMASRKLRQDFDEIAASLPHAGVKGGEGEKLIRHFLNNHIPKRFAATSGFIIDRAENVSKQTDVIIYDALNCPVYRASEDASIIPNDNVAAVVEVKALLDKKRLEEAVNNIATAKRLVKSSGPPLMAAPHSADVSMVAPRSNEFSLSSTFGCVFAFKSAISLETLAQHLRSFTPGLGQHVDLVVVLDAGTIALFVKPPDEQYWGPSLFDGLGGSGTEGALLGYAIQKRGVDTLDAFLRFLLIHLTYFRHVVAHPGMDFISSAPLLGLVLMWAVSLEKDPSLRQQKAQQYIKDFMGKAK